MGLSLPVPGSNQKTWTENEKLSMTIMALITNFVTSAMLKIYLKKYLRW